MEQYHIWICKSGKSPRAQAEAKKKAADDKTRERMEKLNKAQDEKVQASAANAAAQLAFGSNARWNRWGAKKDAAKADAGAPAAGPAAAAAGSAPAAAEAAASASAAAASAASAGAPAAVKAEPGAGETSEINTCSKYPPCRKTKSLTDQKECSTV